MILLILKIIGNILLILLFVLIALILLILFTPFRYIANAEYYDEFKAKVRFRDFFRFLSVRFDFEGEPDFSVYILWGNVKVFPRGPKKKREKKPKKKFFQKKNSKVFDENFIEREVSEEEEKEYKEKLYRSNPDTAKATVNVTDDNETAENSAIKDETAKNASDSAEKNNSADGEKAKIDAPKQKKPKKKKNEKKPRPEFSDTLKEIMSSEYSAGRKILIDKILKLIKHIWPDIKEADVTFSLGEPDTTGYATAVLAMMPFIYGKKKHFEPDFSSEKPYFRGYIVIDGRLFLYYVLYIVISIFVNKNSRKLVLKLLKR